MENQRNRNVKKKYGIFYTPDEIADFICRLTIIPYLSSKNSISVNELLDEFSNEPMVLLKGIEKLKIIDPSCGHGVFLVKAAGILVEIFEKMLESNYFQSNNKKIETQGIELITILKNNIYGIDIKQESVESTKINLNDAINRFFGEIKNKNKPNETIRCEDGLSNEISNGKYSLILGNPPFFTVSKNQEFNNIYPELERDLKPNIASQFLVKYIKSLDENGVLAFIFPASILFSDAFSNLRGYLVNNYSILRIMQLGRAFSTVGLEQIIIFIQNRNPTTEHVVHVVHDIKKIETGDYKDFFVLQRHFIQDRKNRLLIYLKDDVASMVKKIAEKCIPLGDLVFLDPDKNNYLGIFRGMGWEKHLLKEQSEIIGLKAIKGENIMRYGLKSHYFLPHTFSEKESYKLDLVRRKKVILQCIVSSKTRIVATKDEKGIITMSTVENIVLKSNPSISLSYLTGILNSDFMTYYIIDHIFIRSRLTTKLDRKYLETIPIPMDINPNLIKNIENHVRKLEEIVDFGIRAGKTVNGIEMEENYLKNNENLNEKVFEAYGLTKTEVLYIKKAIEEFYGT